MANYPYYPIQGQQMGPQMANVQPYPMPVFNQQTQPVQPQTAPQSVVRFVTTKDEVIGCQIPFDGSVSYFMDTSNGKIYTKAFDPATGTAPVVTYAREQEVQVRYATYDDLAALADVLRAEMKPKRKAAKNDDDE